MKIEDKTELSDSATSYRIRIDAEDLNNKETPQQRYERYLEQARRDRTPPGNGSQVGGGTSYNPR